MNAGESLEAGQADKLAWRGFAPDPSLAEALTAEIGRRLIDSLRYVFGQLGDQLCPTESFAGWIAELEAAKRINPLVHTIFHSIVAEVEKGDLDAARRLTTRLLSLGAADDGLFIWPVDADNDSSHPVALFARFADIEESNRLDLVAPPSEIVGPAIAVMQEGLDLVRSNDPELDGELRAFVSELLLVAQAPRHIFSIAAVSSFQNWGAVLVSPAAHDEPLDIIELAAHEATHLLLFALALDEPLLTNPPDLIYYSPLRRAPRSMDGVFHAAIVSARIARALLRQSDAAGTDSAFGRAAFQRAAGAVQLFDEGVEVIEADAALTPLGRRILDDSKLYIDTMRQRLTLEAAPHLAQVD